MPLPRLDAGLRELARAQPDACAIKDDQEALSYAAMEERVNRLSHLLRAAGIARGDHVACLLPNGSNILCLAWASYRCGAYFTPIATTLTAPEAAYIVNNSGAQVVVADASPDAGLASLAAALPVLCPAPSPAGRIWFSHAAALPGYQPLDLALRNLPGTPIAEESPGALMLYTSGTTGAPKGVRRPLLPEDYRGLPPFARDLLELWGLGGAQVHYLSTQPLYHAAALRTALAVTAGGGRVTVMRRFDAAQALVLLQTDAITHSQWVPTMFQRLLALPEASRRAFAAPAHGVAFHGAAPCPAPVKRAMIDWWGPILYEYYAGTEGVGATGITSAEWLAHPGSVGRATRGIIHIVDDNGDELPSGHSGRIYFEGGPGFEYHGEPEKTQQRIDWRGWQTLGDIGRLDDEGYLTLTDRADDMIISGGVNVYPQEIEAALIELPGVADCAVVGLPDADFGERPHAFVVPKPGAATDTAAFITAIQEALRERLGRVKRPDSIRLVADLPRTPTGKLQRRQLAKLADPAQGRPPHASAAPR